MDKILELKTLKLKAEMEKDWESLQLLMQELNKLRKEIDNLGQKKNRSAC